MYNCETNQQSVAIPPTSCPASVEILSREERLWRVSDPNRSSKDQDIGQRCWSISPHNYKSYTAENRQPCAVQTEQ